MSDPLTKRLLLIAGVLLGLAAFALWPVLRGQGKSAPTSPPENSTPTDDDSEDIRQASMIPASLIKYRQTGEIPVGLHLPHALALGPDGRIYVGGEKQIRVFQPDGAKRDEITLTDEPKCLAVAAADSATPGRLFVGMQKHVEVLDPRGARLAVWKSPGEKAILSSIAVTEQNVFVADAGHMVVWRYDLSGTLLGKIGAADPQRKIPGIIVTSSYFDVAPGANGLIYAVNPRRLRIEAYTPAGDLESHWGKGSPAIEGFFGCCNPAHFAILPDGRFVTAEKGVPRIKVYSPQGQFECVVAGPEQMPHLAADLAADARGRILALDALSECVRVFEPKPDNAGAKP